MTDAISRSAAIEEMSQITFETGYDWERAVNALKGLPALDVQPVVHARWAKEPYLFGWTNRCTRCHENYGMPHGEFSFCPNCGARMDGEAND